MKKRIANKILNAVFEYKNFDRWDMPYNGSQIYRAAKTVLPPKFWKYYKGWHKESVIEGKVNFYKRINETLSR